MRASRLTIALVATAMVWLASPASAFLFVDHQYDYTPTTTRFFMRNGSASCPGTPFLSTSSATGEPSCGYQAGAPFGELFHNGAPVASTVIDYTAKAGMPQYLDPSRSATGTVRIVATQASNRMAAGWVRVDLTLRARTSTGQAVTLGTSSETKLVDPTTSAATDFGFSMPLGAFASLDKQALTSLTLLVDIRGWHILTGFHALNGASVLDLPAYLRTVRPH